MKKNHTISALLLLPLFLPVILNAQQWYNLNSGTTATLNSVYFTSADTGYATGFNGTVLKTTDAGNTWNQLTSGTTENLLYVLFTDANTGYAAGENATVIKTTDAGNNWNALNSGLTAGDHLTSIFFTDVNTGYIAGRYGYIIKTTDAGATWNTQSSGTTNMLEDVYFNSISGTGYTVGTNATIKYTNNGGSFWQAPSNIATINSLNAVAFADQYKGFAGGLNGTLVRCTDGGLYWDSITSGTTNNLLDIAFLNADTGYIAGGNGTILKTTNSGTSWTALTTGTLKDLYAIFFTSATTGYAVGANGTIIKSCSGLIANAGSDTTICSGTSVTIGGTPAASGGTPTYSFSWSPSNSLSASNFENPVATPGSYTVYSLTITDINGCTAADSMNMYVSTSPTTSISSVNVLCNGQAGGSATVTASGGTTQFSYLWNNGATTQTINSIPAGNYFVTVTNSNGCTATDSVAISEPSALILSTAQTDVSCNGANDGTATVNVTGGAGTYTYLWAPSATTVTFTTSGTWTCPQGVTSVDVQVWGSGGGGGYGGGTNKYGGGGGGGGAYSGQNSVSVTPGTNYTITVGDAGVEGTVGSPNGGNGGTSSAILSATISANGGNGALSYANGGTGGAGGIGGTYSGGNGGTGTTTGSGGGGEGACSIQNGTNGALATADPDGGGANACNGGDGGNGSNGNFVVGAAGTGPGGGGGGGTKSSNGGAGAAGKVTITYLISTNSQTTQTATGLPSGTYTVNVTDNNGCNATANVTITEPNVFSGGIVSTTGVSCFGGNDGAITAGGTGGTTPYAYLWFNGSAAETLTNLTAGSYTVTISDANGCGNSPYSTTVNQPSTALTSTSSSTNVTCNGGNDGSACAFAGGGTSPYYWQWNNGATSSCVSNLISGSYSVTSTDANGCTTIINVTVTEPAPVTVGITASSSTTFCQGDSVLLTAIPTDTVGITAYAWSNGATTQSITISSNGNYMVTVTDANGCTGVSSPVSVTVNLKPTVSFSQNNSSCNGSCNGSITSFASSMNSPFNYAWNNGANGSGISALCAGTYSLTVTDNATCTVTDSVTLTEPAATLVNAGIDFTFCSNNVAISLSGNVSGATTTGIWSTNGTGTFSPTDTDLNATYNPSNADLISGNSVLALTSTNNGACSAVSDTAVYTFTPAPAVNAGADQSVCADNATVSLNGIVSGATTAGMWATNGTGTFTPDNTNLNAIYMSSASDTASGNIFIVLVSTNNGNCFPEKDTVYITYNPSPVPIIIPSGSTTFCAGGNVDLDAGTGFSSYVWSTTETTQNINVLSGGAYSVTVTDGNNCTGTASQSVTVNSNPTATAFTNNDASCNGANDGSISVVAGSGTSPYNYLWDNGATTTTINGLAPDTFNVSVTDVNGCFVEAYTIVTEPAALIASAGPDQTICVADSVQLNVSGGQIYSWSPSSGLNNSAISNPIASPMNTTNYVVSVQDTNGCFDTDSITVFVNPFPFINAGSDTIINQGETATLTATGGNSYLWSTTETTSSINVSPFSTTSYFVNAIDSNGCSGADSVTVFVNQIYFSIYGTIYNMAHDTTLNNGTVYLFPYDSLITLAAVDSFLLSGVTGDYAFNNHITDEYIILFRPDNAVYSNSIPTYFGDTTNWDEAQIINLISDTSGIDISTREVPQLSGTGTINGLIQFGIGSGKTTGNGAIPLGDPVPGIDVELEQIPGGIVQHTTTNDSGIYSFTNLPLNYTYKLYVDIPGLPMDSTYTVNLSSTDSTVNNLDYVVDTTSDGTAGIYIGYPLETPGFRLPISGFLIYPNPNNGTFTIQIMNDELRMLNFEVKIYNVLGEIVYAQKTLPDNTNKQLTTELSQGIYNVQVVTGNGIINKKIVVE